VTQVFGSGYADAYDALYADKDYEAECDLIESIASEFGNGCSTFLDLGCGTGGHAIVLASRGRRVTGIDLSPEMVGIARRRAADAGVTSAEFHVGDVRTFRSDETFDVVLLMFAVLGYQLSDTDVQATLETASEHLEPKGVLIFDVWNGPAVEAIGPTTRKKVVPLGSGELRRSARGTLDIERHVCVVDYALEWTIDGSVVSTAREQHQMRYFFDGELRDLAAQSGLEIIRSGAFPEFGRAPQPGDWNALYVARQT
jgi:SAM-dependent methyltransferase